MNVWRALLFRPQLEDSTAYVLICIENPPSTKQYIIYRFDCANVYPTLDKTHDAITDFEKEMAELQKQASLFDVNVPEFKQLKMCRKEVKMLKVNYILLNIIHELIVGALSGSMFLVIIQDVAQYCFFIALI